MRVQIYAGALAGACSDYLKAERPALREPLKGWVAVFAPMSAAIILDEHLKCDNEMKIVQSFHAIALHKRPETLLDMTSEELAPVAQYLAPYEGGRI